MSSNLSLVTPQVPPKMKSFRKLSFQEFNLFQSIELNQSIQNSRKISVHLASVTSNVESLHFYVGDCACKNRRHVQGCGIHSALNRPMVQGTQPEQLISACSQRYKP